MFTRFRYRDPVKAIIEVGAPMDVQEFVSRNGHMTKQEKVTALTERFHDTISGMVVGNATL